MNSKQQQKNSDLMVAVFFCIVALVLCGIVSVMLNTLYPLLGAIVVVGILLQLLGGVLQENRRALGRTLSKLGSIVILLFVLCSIAALFYWIYGNPS
jgi:predicted PurR-regulated permease PerM